MKNNLLKKLREAGGFTQEEVADRLHVATNTIQNWERDFRFKKPEDLHALLDLLEDAAARALYSPGRAEADDLALEFHMRIAYMIAAKCREIREKTGVSKVALTGGVFQNRILMEESLEQLRADGFETYYNISVSPNDGGIALGQAYAASFLDGEIPS